jgi:hypothetical protein
VLLLISNEVTLVRYLIVLLFLVTGSAPSFAQQSAENCAALGRVSLPHTRVESAQELDAGVVILPFDTAPETLPPFCRVVLQLTPTADSDIQMELWLPLQWNHSFRGIGNGGFAGATDLVSLSQAIKQGYASASTDAGHVAVEEDASWALDHPEKVKDFGYRAIHLMTETAHAVVKTFYGMPARDSFFSSCSDGGREALMEAERFPNDYDGIVAGDPAYNWTGMMTNALVNSQLRNKSAAGYIPASSLPLISAAVLAACDGLDGVVDGIVNNPQACHFNPEVLRCKEGAASGSCLTTPQVKSLQSLYAGSTTRDGAQIFPGYMPGGELGPGGWSAWITGDGPRTSGLYVFGQQYFANMVYNNALWNPASFEKDEAYQQANQRTGKILNAPPANLKPFFSHGGKLILYHGWSDPAVSPLSSISYFSDAAATGGPQAAASMRLYMVPGMQHCIGGTAATFFGQMGWFPGEGVDDPQHDVNLALEQWVKQGTAPDTLIASQYVGPPAAGQSTMTRPVCPYPKAVTYKGSGDVNDAANFSCAVPAGTPSLPGMRVMGATVESVP